LKQHRPWFDRECLGFLEQRKQATIQWVQDPRQSNVDNLNNVRCEASRHFRNKKKTYLNAKIEELENNSKIKNNRYMYRGISDLKKGKQPRTNIVQDEKGDLVAYSNSVLVRWRNHFSQLLNIHGVRQTDLHTAQPLVPEPHAIEFGLPIEKLKSHKPPGIDEIRAELIKAGGRTICSEIHKRIISIWNKEKLLEEWKESNIVPP
jgi:hypothetical protein